VIVTYAHISIFSLLTLQSVWVHIKLFRKGKQNGGKGLQEV